MDYHVYKRSRDAAWEFLIDNDIRSLPVTFSQICRDHDISLMRYLGSGFFKENERGISYIKDDRFNILVNGADDTNVQRFTIAHELGHIFLGHLDEGNAIHTRLSGTRDAPKSKAEYQAERFAMGILAPACVLWGADIRRAADIERICCIPHEEALIRVERMRLLYKRNSFFRIAA
ncbi:MAG: ImmA/IrrE family metallo-endopeptidase [Ruminococcus sp.]|nr:ImmA/IrrE family metallo-endopeptidase [Ruminococcus sp.]